MKVQIGRMELKVANVLRYINGGANRGTIGGVNGSGKWESCQCTYRNGSLNVRSNNSIMRGEFCIESAREKH